MLETEDKNITTNQGVEQVVSTAGLDGYGGLKATIATFARITLHIPNRGDNGTVMCILGEDSPWKAMIETEDKNIGQKLLERGS